MNKAIVYIQDDALGGDPNQQIAPFPRRYHCLTISAELVSVRTKLLRKQGIDKIISQQYREALQLFEECEKILEYSANCGRSIDRELILSILHNEAVVYQSLGETAKALSYVEAVIYNINESLEGSDHPHPAKTHNNTAQK